jgi:hypothetical protein
MKSACLGASAMIFVKTVAQQMEKMLASFGRNVVQIVNILDVMWFKLPIF